MPEKLIIFDLDGTLYDINDVLQAAYDTQVEYLALKLKKTRKEAESFLYQNQIYPFLTNESKSATELFLRIGVDKQDWAVYREERFDVNKIQKSKAISELTIKSFAKYGMPVLLSSNSYGNIKRILNHIKISLSVFQEIICSDCFPFQEPFNKKNAICYISQKYSIQYEDMYSVGDRFTTDIEPMLELGGRGILISKPCVLEDVLADLMNNQLHNTSNYYYY